MHWSLEEKSSDSGSLILRISSNHRHGWVMTELVLFANIRSGAFANTISIARQHFGPIDSVCIMCVGVEDDTEELYLYDDVDEARRPQNLRYRVAIVQPIEILLNINVHL